MKTLKELGLTFKEVKAVCGSLNASGLSETKIRLVGLTGEAMIVNLISIIDAIADKDMPKIPKDVQDFYEALPDEVFNVNVTPAEVAAGTAADAAPVAAAIVVIDGRRKEDKERADKTVAISDRRKDGEVTGTTKEEPVTPAAPVKADKKEKAAKKGKASEPTPAEPTAENQCPDFGKGFSEAAKECVACGTDFPKEHINCKRVMRGVPVPEPEPKKKPSLGVMKSRYGHRINTMAACIDDMIWAGATLAKITSKVVKWYGKSDKAASAAVLRHIKYLPGARGITTATSEGGVFKADKEFSTGQNAQNTAKAVPAVAQTK